MTDLTQDQIVRLNAHLANAASFHGVLLGELQARNRGGKLKKSQRITMIRRELVAWLRQTVWFLVDGNMVLPGDIHAASQGDKPISYPLIAKLMGFSDHTAALLAHRKWKQLHPEQAELTSELTGNLPHDEIEQRKRELHGFAPHKGIV